MFVVGLFIVPSAEFYFFSSDSLNCAASIVRVRYYTNQIVLNTLWNSYLNQATKNVYRYLYFPNFPIPKEIPWWKISKQKRNPFIISVTWTLLSPSELYSPQPPPRAGPRVRYHCLRCSFRLLVVVRLFSPFLCLSWFLSVWKYPNALCNCIAIWSKGVLPRS